MFILFFNYIFSFRICILDLVFYITAWMYQSLSVMQWCSKYFLLSKYCIPFSGIFMLLFVTLK